VTRLRTLFLATFLALVVGACGWEPVQRQPVSSDDGLHLSGRLAGTHVHVNVGEPEVRLGACVPERPAGGDLCIVGRTIEGVEFTLIIENPGGFVTGERMEIRPYCPNEGCNGIALVEVQRGTERVRITGGELEVSSAGPSRYAARFTLRAGAGTLTGAFDVDPRRAPD
jgi:hypothetical protein